MVDHGDEVLGDLHVELDNVRSGRDCVLEGGYGVLANVGTAAEQIEVNMGCLRNT